MAGRTCSGLGGARVDGSRRVGPLLAQFVRIVQLICVGPCLGTILIAGTAHAERHETAATTPPTDGKVLGIAFVGRMVADLDKSVPFYEAIGLTRDPSVDSSWRRDEALNHLFGIKGARFRTAKFTINSNISGKPFAIYLHELKGIKRITVGGYPPWEPGASHFGLVVPDAALVWSQLKAHGMLRARSWGGELIPFPGETKGALAYMTDPDGLDIELINQRPAAPAQRRPPREAGNSARTQPCRPGYP